MSKLHRLGIQAFEPVLSEGKFGAGDGGPSAQVMTVSTSILDVAVKGEVGEESLGGDLVVG